MNDKAKILIVLDEELSQAVQLGYYPEITQLVNKGDCKVFSLEDFYRGNISAPLKQRPKGNGRDVYVRNPYTNVYECIYAPLESLGICFVSDKSLALKEALVRMGAKRILMLKEDKASEKKHDSVSLGGSYKGVSGSVSMSLGSGYSNAVKKALEYSNPNNQPQNWEEAYDYIQNHGLIGESFITLLCDRLKTMGKLNGVERISVSYLNELSDSFGMTLGAGFKEFGVNVGYETEAIRSSRFECLFEVEF